MVRIPLKNIYSSVILILLVLLSLTEVDLLRADTIAEKKKMLAEVGNDLKSKKIALQKAAKNEKKIANIIKQIDCELTKSEEKINLLEKEIKSNKINLSSTQHKLRVINTRLNRLKELFCKRMEGIYKYSKWNTLEVLLTAKDFADLSRRFYFMTLIGEIDSKLLSEIKDTQIILENKKERIEKEYVQVQQKKSIEEKNLSKKLQMRLSQKDLLKKTKSEKKAYEEQTAWLQKESSQLLQLINRLEAEKKVGKKSVAKSQPVETEDILALKRKFGKLIWPVKGEIVKKFGMEKHPKFNTNVMNSGINISAPMGKSVYAAASGKVVFTGWYKGYGQLIMLDHGTGLYSLYGHLSEILTSLNTYVNASTIIGKVGNTGMMDSPALHFELRVKGKPVNPIGWLG